MLQLFKVEWLKIRKYRTFWVLFSAFCLLYPLTFFFAGKKYMEAINPADKEMQMVASILGSHPFVFPAAWHTSAWFGGLFFIILGMLFILLITNEVQYRTHRQNIIDGWSRVQFLLAKLSLMIFFIAVSSIIVFACALVSGLIYTGENSLYGPFERSHYVWYYVLMATDYLVVAFIIAILIKRTGLAIIIYFVVIVADSVFWSILTLRNSQVGYFLPLEVTDSLVPHPFIPKQFTRRTVPDWSLVLGSVVYIVGLSYLTMRYFKKTDLKT